MAMFSLCIGSQWRGRCEESLHQIYKQGKQNTCHAPNVFSPLETSHLVTTMTFNWFRHIYIDKYWQLPYCYAIKKKTKQNKKRHSLSVLRWVMMARFQKHNVSSTKVAHRLTPDIDTARTHVRESTAADSIPVTNIAIKAWFMVHHRREVQGLEHKTVQLWEVQ